MSEYELDLGGVEEPDVSYDNFYSKAMSYNDVLANIFRNLKDPDIAGITHSFQGDYLIVSVHVYEKPNEKIMSDCIPMMKEVVKWVKKKYKEATGKTLKMKQLSDNYDVVGNYTSMQKAKITYTVTFDISANKLDQETNSLDVEQMRGDDHEPDFKIA
jgi:hypothetical protein